MLLIVLHFTAAISIIQSAGLNMNTGVVQYTLKHSAI